MATERTRLPDYYETLQVSPRAHPVVIAKAYRLLAALYHPDNKETGDAEAFKHLVTAYHVLSDPLRRAAYDRERFGATAPRNGSNGSSEVDFSPPPDRPPADERELRQLILRALYDVRRSRPYKPGLSLLVISELLAYPIQDMEFTLWYLKAKKFIEVIEDSDIAITAVGVDHIEANANGAGHEPRDIMSLPAPQPTADARPAGPRSESNARS